MLEDLFVVGLSGALLFSPLHQSFNAVWRVEVAREQSPLVGRDTPALVSIEPERERNELKCLGVGRGQKNKNRDVYCNRHKTVRDEGDLLLNRMRS